MRKEFKIGLFTIIIMVLSFFLINYLRGEDIFNREIELSARYSSVEGLVPSSPVFIKGYKAGKVSSVKYDTENEVFEVVCSIKKEFRIPQDSKMTIYGVDIMGTKGVRIDLGTSDVAAQDGDSLIPGASSSLLLYTDGKGYFFSKSKGWSRKDYYKHKSFCIISCSR